MSFDPRPIMRSAADELCAQSTSAVQVHYMESRNEPNCELVFQPASPVSAAISWMLIGDNFIVSTGRCEWQSEEWIPYRDDEDEFVRQGLQWSEDLIQRISRHGAAFIRLRGLAPSFLRETRATVRDEPRDDPFDVLESWQPW